MKPSEGHLRETPAAPTASIPAPVQTPPALPRPRPTTKPETYSVVVNNVRVHELLFALARDAKLNVDIHPGINGAITLNAIDQTLPQLLNRIARQVDMRYELDGPNLAVMPDSPYLRVYKIDYVNMERQTRGTVSVSGNILSTGGVTGTGGTSTAGGMAGSATGTTNASTLSVQNVTTNRFWDTLEKNIEAILRETDKVIPGPGAAAPAAAVPPPPPSGQQPINGTAPAVPAPSVTYREAASVISNPEAGVITVRATGRQHEKIQEFLDQVLVNVKRQVLIEATIVEVRLSNNYQQGIDWGIFSGLSGFQFLQGGLYRTTPPATPPVPQVGLLTAQPDANLLAGQYNSRDFKATVQLLETFGTVRVLSSPRISVINNQTAVLKVVDNIVYFLVQSTTSQAQTNVVNSVNTTPQSVSVGFIMNVTPQIDDAGAILLNVKPTISRVQSFVRDPNPLIPASIPNLIPQIQQRELESVLRVTSGDVAVMGGLIQDEVRNNEDTLPGINRVPVLGDMLANRNLLNGKTELVIFLRPQVIRDPSIDGDYSAYRVFLPGEDFLSKPNPGRRQLDLGNGASK